MNKKKLIKQALKVILLLIGIVLTVKFPCLLALTNDYGSFISFGALFFTLFDQPLSFIGEYCYKIVSKQKLKKRERIGINKRAKSISEISDKLKRKSNPDFQQIYRNVSCLSYNTAKNTTNKAKQVAIKVVQFHISEPSTPDVFTLILKPSRNI